MEYSFRANPSILLHLGEQLIKNESIALTELIKNSYDADSKNVVITFENIYGENQQSLFEPKIIIEDDGCGMDLNIIKNKWLEIGTNNKNEMIKSKEYSPKYKRLPLGEKGIGRLGVHKLGNSVEIITRVENGKEVYVCIEWEQIKTAKSLDDVKIMIEEKETQYFKNRTGTKIIIKKLKNTWEDSKIKNVHNSLNTLLSPFKENENFDIKMYLNGNDLNEIYPTVENFLRNSLFYFKAKVGKGGLENFEYKFTPFEAIKNKIEERVVLKEDKVVQRIFENQFIENKDMVPFEMEGFIFDLDSSVTQLISDKQVFKNYLSLNNGIRVYRDSMRVYNYGEPDDDWLELNQRRINRLGKGLNKGLILGAVSLNRDESLNLIEKSNREGFVENEIFKNFKNNALAIIDIVEHFRHIDRGNLYSILGKHAKTKEPVLNELETLKEICQEKIEDANIQKDLMSCIGRVEKNYKELRESFLLNSSLGINMSIIFHEVEKSISFLSNEITESTDLDSLKLMVMDLVKIIEQGKNVLEKGDSKFDSLNESIKILKIATKLREERHNFKIEYDLGELENLKVSCSKKTIIGMLFNLISNSIEWLTISNISNKKILIKLTKEINGYLSIVVSDNGPGFILSGEEATKMFVTTKPKGKGIGLGLFITNEMMKNCNGLLLIDNVSSLISLPNDYKNGASVALCFKEENNNGI